MAGVYRGLTGLILAVTVLLVVAGVAIDVPGLQWAAAGVALACGAVWLFYRPTSFTVTSGTLSITWPARRLSVPLAEITSARIVESPAEAKDLLGPGFRIGVGGLFGTFGLVWSKKMGMLSVYVTRTSDLVLLERRDARPMLLTPVDAEGFVEALGYGAARDAGASAS